MSGGALLMLDYKVELCRDGERCLAPPLAEHIPLRNELPTAARMLHAVRTSSANRLIIIDGDTTSEKALPGATAAQHSTTDHAVPLKHQDQNRGQPGDVVASCSTGGGRSGRRRRF